jgi:hypothetical protein
MPWKTIVRWLRVLGLITMAVAALFGIPIVIDPPPREVAAEVQELDTRRRRKRRLPPR